MSDGRGALCQVRMSVAQLGKIDLYQWLAFLAQHMNRHLAQMEANAAEFDRASDLGSQND